jgi:outer membrane protein OmpA-like peptidoglycan-associated protein
MRAQATWVLAILAIATGVSAQSRGGAPSAAAPPAERIDYLTFAQGAVPIRIDAAGAKLGADWERAIRIIDGNPQGFTLTPRPFAGETGETIFVYELPAPTVFDRFAVPNVLETPAPNQTFTRQIEILGSAQSATAGFEPLASAMLETHTARGQITEIPVTAKRPVRWIQLRLAGGIAVLGPQMFFEFSEIIGNGTQEPPLPVTHFSGSWRTMGLRLQLKQEGAVVSGCYDRAGDLTGTVTGNILRATGVNRFDKTRSAFILSLADDGSVRGVRSDNGGPFNYYTVAKAPAGTVFECGQPAPPTLGCGSIIHGITFDFDSAAIRPESSPVLAELHKGLAADTRSRMVIEGHTSSEGTEDYNLRLSERRAQAVVADLVSRGLAGARVSAAGLGESRPIASNNDESGRSLNRRVEVKCQ